MSQPSGTHDRKTVSVLGPTLKFSGELIASEDLVIRGKVEGTVRHSSKLTIGAEGEVNANIRAEVIAVEGTVRGDLVAKAAVILSETSEVDGNIFCPSVTLAEGAKFNGRIDMSGEEEAGAETPTAESVPVAGDEPANDSNTDEDTDDEAVGAA